MAFAFPRRPLAFLALAFLFVVILSAAYFSGPTTTVALPAYAAATGQVCGTCHVNPAGGGPLTAKGQQFQAVATHITDPAGAWAQINQPTATAVPAAATATPVPAAPTATQPPATPTAAAAATPTAAASAATATRPAAAATAIPAATTLPKTGGLPMLPFVVGGGLLVLLGLGVRRFKRS